MIFVLLFILILSKQKSFAQMYLTLDQAIELSQYSNDYETLQADSLIAHYNDRLFKIKVLPKINLSAT